MLRCCALPCTSTHTSCYGAVRSRAPAHTHTHVMLHSCAFLCTCTHASCYASVRCDALPHTRHATLLCVLMQEATAFDGKHKVDAGSNENRWQWARSFQRRHNAAISSHLGRTFEVLVAELRNKLLTRMTLTEHGFFFTSKHKFQTFFQR